MLDRLPRYLAEVVERLQGPDSAARVQLIWKGVAFGSLHARVAGELQHLWRTRPPSRRWERASDHVWTAQPALEEALPALVSDLVDIGRIGPWRGESLPVMDDLGRSIGEVERGAVRVLGIRTTAVHLSGIAPDGRVWLQLRARHKANDPGLWDTLAGGLMAAHESIADTLERETHEEAGLEVQELGGLVPLGFFDIERASPEAGATGFMRERLVAWQAVVPQDLRPRNLDGEVERFELLDRSEVASRVVCGLCTDEATWVLARSLGWPLPELSPGPV